MQKQTVLFCGDVNTDLILASLDGPLSLDREVVANQFALVLGSSAAIAASAHARLGGKTLFSGLGGDDAYGHLVQESLAEAGVGTDYLVLDPSLRTGLTLNLVQAQGRFQVTYPGAIPRFAPDPVTLTADPRIAHVHCAGIYLQTEFFPRLPEFLTAMTEAGISTSVDPQWDGSGRWDGLESWLPRVGTLFCNEEEAQALARIADPRKALERLATICPTVVMKRGSQGAEVRTPEGHWSVPGYRVVVQDSIGAGDNFAAAWIFGTRTLGLEAEAALAFANAAAARSCTFPGGTAAQSTAADVQRFQRQNPFPQETLP